MQNEIIFYETDDDNRKKEESTEEKSCRLGDVKAVALPLKVPFATLIARPVEYTI